MPQRLTPEIIIAAIAGFEVQKTQIEAKISDIKRLLDGGTGTTAPTETAQPRKKRSAAVRRRMALAQRARFAKLKEGWPWRSVLDLPSSRKAPSQRKLWPQNQRSGK